MKIRALKTDNRINPIGMDNKTPAFSWMFDDKNYSLQKAYRITVTSSKDDITMWDYFEKSSQSIGIIYAGKPLQSSCIYKICLIVSGENGDTAIADGTFETGLIEKSDWKGTWAGSYANFQGNTTIVRKVFSIDRKDIVRARAYVLGLGYLV